MTLVETRKGQFLEKTRTKPQLNGMSIFGQFRLSKLAMLKWPNRIKFQSKNIYN